MSPILSINVDIYLQHFISLFFQFLTVFDILFIVLIFTYTRYILFKKIMKKYMQKGVIYGTRQNYDWSKNITDSRRTI